MFPEYLMQESGIWKVFLRWQVRRHEIRQRQTNTFLAHRNYHKIRMEMDHVEVVIIWAVSVVVVVHTGNFDF